MLLFLRSPPSPFPPLHPSHLHHHHYHHHGHPHHHGRQGTSTSLQVVAVVVGNEGPQETVAVVSLKPMSDLRVAEHLQDIRGRHPHQ